MSDEQNPSLSAAVNMFLSTMSQKQRQEGHQELNRFVRWYGGERLIRDITAREIGDYGKNISASVTDPEKKIEPVRNFLSYAMKKKFIGISLSPHLRVSKAKQKRSIKQGRAVVDPVALTSEGHASLEAELEALKKERPRISEQIRLAAADKDFRENAPLEAAREHQGQIEARIREIEATLSGSTLIKERPKGTKKAGIGCTVSLRDLGSGEQLSYTLVSPSEADPIRGKISVASPTGKALLNHETGAIVKVVAPVGTLRYQIDDIKG
jgi:transcription elongation factor GreA